MHSQFLGATLAVVQCDQDGSFLLVDGFTDFYQLHHLKTTRSFKQPNLSAVIYRAADRAVGQFYMDSFLSPWR
jgi:uncharacterized pyridoxamine 5'-phosphate oxidase family protein